MVELEIEDPEAYARWIRKFDTLSPGDRAAIKAQVARLRERPLVAVVLIEPADAGSLARLLADMRGQLYPVWELFLPAAVAGASPDKRVRMLVGEGDPAARFNATIAQTAATIVIGVPADVRIREHALHEIIHGFAEKSEVDLVYSDEDRLNADGTRIRPFFKPDFDPDFLLGRDMIGNLAAYRRERLVELGGMDQTLGSASVAQYELALRVSHAVGCERIRHVPAVLCHRSAAAIDRAQHEETEARRDIVASHLAATSPARVHRVHATPSGWVRVEHPLPERKPLVSVIVPTRDRPELFERCALGVLNRTDYPNLELLVVDNNSEEFATFETLRRLAKDPRVRVLPYPGAFNYSAINNFAAREAAGEILLLLNNDTDVIGEGWLTEMVSHAVRPDIGAVGAKLLYGSGRVQHAGIVFGPTGGITHLYRGVARDYAGPNGELAMTRTLSGATAACLAIRREVYFEVGGLDEDNLKVALNDVDLCLRLGDFGYRIVWTPFAELFHLESASRGPDSAPAHRARITSEINYISRLWGGVLERDPCQTPNLDYAWATTTFGESVPRRAPWRPMDKRRPA